MEVTSPIHELEADFIPRYRPPERKPARLLSDFIRIINHLIS